MNIGSESRCNALCKAWAYMWFSMQEVIWGSSPSLDAADQSAFCSKLWIGIEFLKGSESDISALRWHPGAGCAEEKSVPKGPWLDPAVWHPSLKVVSFGSFVMKPKRTAPILMKLGQNSVWCLISSEKNF
eukprot:sb/3475133/